jgi:hypothetical protein
MPSSCRPRLTIALARKADAGWLELGLMELLVGAVNHKKSQDGGLHLPNKPEFALIFGGRLSVEKENSFM